MIRSFEKRAEQKISGFQSPAADYLEGRLDLNDKIIVDPHSTFYFCMDSVAMQSYGIQLGDLLIVDRSLTAVHGAVVIAFHQGNFSCRMLIAELDNSILKNDQDEIIETAEIKVGVWGVVTAICRGMLPNSLKTGRYRDVCTL